MNVTTDEAARASDLRRMKGFALALLLFATGVFVAFQFIGDEGWRGYVETAAEAAMVGGLADWFAVTALFRHPLRLPIPHTAIIPTRKDQIGASLGGFVEENFLDGEVLAERVASMDVSSRLASWLAAEGNAEVVAARGADALVGLTHLLDDDVVHEALQAFVTSRLQRTSSAPVLARALDAAVHSGQHQAALDAVLRGVERMIVENEEVFRARIHHESPWWVPTALDDRVLEKLISGFRSLISEVLANPNHQLRSHISLRMSQLAKRLRTDKVLAKRVDSVRDELLERPELSAWFAELWGEFEVDLAAAAKDPDSSLHRRLTSGVTQFAARLESDDDLRDRIDGYLAGFAKYAADSSGNEVSDLISSTVARWDADDTSRRIELQVGRDLQYIRINGTVVGALAGLAIHAVAQMLG